MTPFEALLEVQAALRDRGLPGGVGLREADRTFIVALGPGQLGARAAVAELLTLMGCEITASGHRDTVFGHLAGGLLPAPPLPPVVIRSADSCSVAELAEVTAAEPSKKCADCLGWFPVATGFGFLNKSTGRRCSYCHECERRRWRAGHEARKARAGVTIS